MMAATRSCLLAFLLCCNLTAAIIEEIIEEQKYVALRCPGAVRGEVTWSRERNGNKTKILTNGDQNIKHIHDPYKRYNTLADKSLIIMKANLSDTGRYFCNGEPAVDLTVIPSGTKIKNATKGTKVTLSCPPDVGGSHGPLWRSEAEDINTRKRFIVSTENRTLTIRNLKPGDSGLYYCGGKPAVYLRVITGDQSDRGKSESSTSSTSTPSTTRPTNTATQPDPPLGLVFGVAAPFILLLLLIIVIVSFKKCRFKKQGREDEGNVYSEIQEGLLLKPTKDSSDQMDPTYAMISEAPTVESVHEPAAQNLMEETERTYFLLEKPKPPGSTAT